MGFFIFKVVADCDIIMAQIIPFPEDVTQCVIIHTSEGEEIVPLNAIHKIITGQTPLDDPEWEPTILAILKEWHEWQVEE